MAYIGGNPYAAALTNSWQSPGIAPPSPNNTWVNPMFNQSNNWFLPPASSVNGTPVQQPPTPKTNWGAAITNALGIAASGGFSNIQSWIGAGISFFGNVLFHP